MINRKYPKYKKTGVEWLGEVPEGWEVKNLALRILDRTAIFRYSGFSKTWHYADRYHSR
jgi:hypothetical protein